MCGYWRFSDSVPTAGTAMGVGPAVAGSLVGVTLDGGKQVQRKESE